MNLQQQCISLDLAKRLKELDVTQISHFVWRECKESYREHFPEGFKPNIISKGELTTYDYVNENQPYEVVCSAFTAAELLELLPHHITTKEPEPFNSYRLYITGSVIVKNPEHIDPIRTHIVNYKCDTYSVINDALSGCKYLTKNIWDENPANAFAKMLIFLYEQGLITNE